jgi:hypothetical protein
MNEETEALLAQAASGNLDTESRRRWEALCREQPGLEDEASALEAVMRRLQDSQQHAEQRARATAPAEPPPWVVAQLETARQQVFKGKTAAIRPGLWQRLRTWLGKGSHLPLALAGAAAVVALLSAPQWLSQLRQEEPTLNHMPLGRAETVSPVFKESVSSPELPLAMPGAQTRLTDPPVLWISLSREPVKLTLLDAQGAELASGEAVRAPLSWQDWAAEAGPLQPGASYLLRLKQCGNVTERVMTVQAEARTLNAWAADGDAVALAAQWLNQGHAADALALLRTVSAENSSAMVQELRARAMKAALETAEAAEPDGRSPSQTDSNQ